MLRDQTKVPCGFFWKKKDANGKPYMAGVISFGVRGEIPVVIFEEENKPNENAPDYVMRNAITERRSDAPAR